MNLNEVKLKQKVRIIEVKGSDRVRRRLLDMGLTRNSLVEVIGKAPLGDPLKIKVRGYILTMRKEEAKNIEVSEK